MLIWCVCVASSARVLAVGNDGQQFYPYFKKQYLGFIVRWTYPAIVNPNIEMKDDMATSLCNTATHRTNMIYDRMYVCRYNELDVSMCDIMDIHRT